MKTVILEVKVLHSLLKVNEKNPQRFDISSIDELSDNSNPAQEKTF